MRRQIRYAQLNIVFPVGGSNPAENTQLYGQQDHLSIQLSSTCSIAELRELEPGG